MMTVAPRRGSLATAQEKGSPAPAATSKKERARKARALRAKELVVTRGRRASRRTLRRRARVSRRAKLEQVRKATQRRARAKTAA